MQTGDTIIQDSQAAVEYDLQARKTKWFGSEVVFGLAYELVKPGDSLLDLGIGSGLSSLPFYKAGLHVYGLDGSSEILKVCASKGFAVELKQHDLHDLPLPYPSNFCNHVVSVAVLNFLRDLYPLFKEIARIIEGNGIFAFTVEAQKSGQEDSYTINQVGASETARVETAVRLFRHSDDYIARLIDRSGFVMLKVLEFLAFTYPAESRDVFFKAYVARKTEDIGTDAGQNR
jgi:predicted TPR repeat methyltransferase